MLETLCKTRTLDSEDLTTVYRTCRLILRHEVYRLDVTTYITLIANLIYINLHNTHLGSLGIVECVTRSTTCRDILNIDIGNNHAVITHKAFADTKHSTELRNNGITRKDKVA